MALIKTSTLIRSIRGRCGGNYFKRGTDGLHIQAMPRHVLYAHTLPQSPGIGGFSTMAPLWLMALCAYFASLWTAYALANLFTTKSGERKRISGYNWYIHYGLRFPETERPPFWKPPHAPGEMANFIATGYKDYGMYRISYEDWPEWYPFDFFWDRHMLFEGQPRYGTDNFNWSLWWNGERWVVSPEAGMIAPDRTWYSPTHKINDYYHNPIRNHHIHIYPARPQFYEEP